MSVRLYGRAQGNSSHARVTSGFYRVLEAEGMLSGFVGVDLGAISEDVQRERNPLALRGAVADYGIFTGPLGALEQMLYNTSHRERLVMVAPNSNLLPTTLLRELSRVATMLLAPSEWARGVLAGLMDLPVVTAAHGVTDELDAATRAELAEQRVHNFADGQFRVLHLSTSDRARKGTLELCRAWTDLLNDKVIPAQSVLVLVLDYQARIRLVEQLVDDEIPTRGIVFLDRIDGDAAAMARLISSAHVVCQPSRGEAFGLVPLEALSVGVPVVATACTGHSEYLSESTPGAIVVATGEPEPIDDLPGAMAPRLDWEDVSVALCAAYNYWDELHTAALAHARSVTERWSWERQLAPLITQLKGMK